MVRKHQYSVLIPESLMLACRSLENKFPNTMWGLYARGVEKCRDITLTEVVAPKQTVTRICVDFDPDESESLRNDGFNVMIVHHPIAGLRLSANEEELVKRGFDYGLAHDIYGFTDAIAVERVTEECDREVDYDPVARIDIDESKISVDKR